jgi:hypothetical protein
MCQLAPSPLGGCDRRDPLPSYHSAVADAPSRSAFQAGQPPGHAFRSRQRAGMAAQRHGRARTARSCRHVVSWDAQYVMVSQARHIPAIAALEAGIPDTGALIFATLGIALALHGRRALRPRTLNVACVGLSLTMNAMAAGPGWRDTAIWVMPAAVYALASDTLIGVVRAWALARMHATGQALEGEEITPLAVVGAIALWLLRLALAPASTLAGFRRWTVEECPVSPGRKAPIPPPAPQAALPPAELPAFPPGRRSSNGKPHKQDLLIALASQRYDLHRTPLNRVARIAGQIAAEVGLHPGTARRVLRAHVHALQQPAPRTTEARQ